MSIENVVEAFVFVAACVLAWYPGNKLIWTVWKAIARSAKVPLGEQTELARKVGGLERILYIFGAMADHYEIVTGWLVMKAFFGWIEVKRDADTTQAQEAALRDYNGVLIGNIVSVLIGLFVGIVAKELAGYL